ncbi:unnamed protein product [Protopolystoma xenopodis]|uniref:Uncharacterized protein n=1 Tax=Protopolystoma xenopodis TaxID=117903 RepID=A0A3S5AHQ2_9PLAT|nr:unnamed protein product [Protopolystoma xenopodis]
MTAFELRESRSPASNWYRWSFTASDQHFTLDYVETTTFTSIHESGKCSEGWVLPLLTSLLLLLMADNVILPKEPDLSKRLSIC